MTKDQITTRSATLKDCALFERFTEAVIEQSPPIHTL